MNSSVEKMKENIEEKPGTTRKLEIQKWIDNLSNYEDDDTINESINFGNLIKTKYEVSLPRMKRSR